MPKHEAVPVKIRRARRADSEQIVALARELARHVDDPVPGTTPADIRRVAFGSRRWCDIQVAVLSGSVIGYAMYSMVFEASTGDRRLFLGDLVVAPTVRRKGVGRALMQQVITEAKRLGCGRVTWEVWKANRAALDFYSYLPTEVDEVDVLVLKRRQYHQAIRTLRSL